ncbi:MAG: ABC-F family ATP-binding cassette domain-containing protein [Proteobacteria bacterium]|nr:ABC-F family ATP-binding cassette domain-containing protein [Pseudomonadota bacterium]MBU1686656.1 ABC-F family ATP-binding cassette domain-containing protein [Pseudomonadota bacterium]
MININKLTLQYGKKDLFKDVSGRINSQDRIGLIGVNGTGKTTLLKMMVGIVETDFGVITKSRHTTIGYLPQEIADMPPGQSIYQEAESAFADLLEIEKELNELNRTLSACDPSSPEIADLLEQQGELQHQLDRADIFSMQARIEKVLHGLGFSTEDFKRDCHQFSGGWIMRLMLAKLLLVSPAFLLLDEPTNHLDIESLTWLEDFLKGYGGGLILISHDRSFLDAISTSTWELSLGRLTIYKGNYTKYLAEKEVRMEVQRAAYGNQQALIQQTKRFVEKFRAKSTKASQVQSRIKQLAKLDLIELDESDLSLAFRFPPAAPSGRLAIAGENLTKSFENKTVFDDLSFDLQRGDKMGIVGVNGAGKSTLVKMLAGLIKPDLGQIRSGHNVILSYFGQHQAQELPLAMTVMEVMMSIDSGKTVTQLRSLLGAFLFRGDDVDKKVSVLSGGEKSRLALARMIATPANLLIMDEPTNHLDMGSQEILQEAMAQYDGSIIVVSHNRYFADSFINKVLEIKSGRATIYDGNITYYLEKIQATRQKPTAATIITTPLEATPETPVKTRGKEARQVQAHQRKERNKLLGSLQKKVTEAEKKVEALERTKETLESILADPNLYQDQEAFGEKSREYSTVTRHLEKAYSQWEEAQSEIELREKELEDSAS